MNGYAARCRSSWIAGSGEHCPQTGALTALVYACVAAYVAFWIAVGPSSKWFSHYLREGSPIDMLSTTFLGTSAALAGVAFTVARKWRARLFWLLCALASLFLMLDERLQLHEQARHLLGGNSAGSAPLGLRNWNDATMLGYGVVALVLGLLTLPAFLRHRRVRTFLIVGFGFFVIHTAIDMSFEAGPLKDVFEEPGKLLAGASFMLAFLHAVLIEVQQRVAEPNRPAAAAARGLGWTYPALFLVLAAISAWLFTEPTGERLHKLLWHNWGYPHRWLTAVYLQLAAIVIVAASFLRRAGLQKPDWSGLPLAAGLWFLSIGEAMNASRYRFAHDRVKGDFLPSLRKKLDVLHNDLEPIHWLTFAAMVAAFVVGANVWSKHPRASRWLRLGLFTLLAALVVNVVTDVMGGALNDFGEIVLSPWLRVIGSACVALGSLELLVSMARATAFASKKQSRDSSSRER